MVSTEEDTVVQIEFGEDRHDVFMNFSAPFQIHDDTEVLKALQLHKAPKEQLTSLISETLMEFLPETESAAPAAAAPAAASAATKKK